VWQALDKRPLLALAVLCLLLFLPGFFTIPPVDRDEARFAQAAKQMLESGDFVAIRFQDEPRHKKPAGIYWLQAGTASLFGGAARDRIWAYRLPSLIGACASVLLTYWAGLPLFGRRAALIGAALLASSFLLGVEARLAKTDAVLLATIVAAQGALARLYLGAAARNALALALLFWAALGLGILIKGPLAPLVIALTLVALVIFDRRAGWLWSLRPLLGIPLALLIVAPWAFAINKASGGSFFGDAIAGDLVPKLLGAQASHGAPPGYFLVAAVVTFWSGALFFLPALAHAVSFRNDARFRFALAWAVPMWLVFELIPTKLPHYVLPAFPALALLMGAVIVASEEDVATPFKRVWGKAAIVLFAVTALAFALLLALLRPFVEGTMSIGDFVLASLLYAAAALTIWYALEGRHAAAAAGAVVCALILSAGAFGVLAPKLEQLWVSKRLVEVLPRGEDGALPPLGAAGYGEPSLVFLAGTGTVLAGPEALVSLLQERPDAIAAVAAADRPAFLGFAREAGLRVTNMGRVEGFNYSNGKRVALSLYRTNSVAR
jgi:4-amino-4-deoxy-L-arabinose transferase-like glycosyltransferase